MDNVFVFLHNQYFPTFDRNFTAKTNFNLKQIIVWMEPSEEQELGGTFEKHLQE